MYGFSVQFIGDFETAVQRTTQALQAEGFGVLCDIDVSATLRKKLGVETPPYRILGACNPHLAHQALSQEPDLGLLLPCNVTVRQEVDGAVTVSFIDPEQLLAVVQNPALAPVGADVRARFQRVMAVLQAG